MTSDEATLEQIRRLNAGLHWKKVETLFKRLGAEVYEGSGSTVTFVLEGRKLTVDRPHPRRVRTGARKADPELPRGAWASVNATRY